MTTDVLSSPVRVLLVDSKPMESQLLAAALRNHGFEVSCCGTTLESMMELIEQISVDVAVICCAGPAGLQEMTALRGLHFANPQLPKIGLLEIADRESVVQAFRSGARGIICLAESSFQLLCECIQGVHRGEIWADTQQLNYLLESVCQAPTLQVVGTRGETLLTSREEQVVALVADGLSNRDVATELGLSEHTVKKYLFRIFDKLGISNRVELVLYAFHHGVAQTVGWAANA